MLLDHLGAVAGLLGDETDLSAACVVLAANEVDVMHRSAMKNGEADEILSILVMESTVNIIKATPA